MGWAFKKNTNDTRESAAIYVANNLIKNQILIDVYDPKVERKQINLDLSQFTDSYNPKMLRVLDVPDKNLSTYNTIAILTEWDEFKNYDWENIYKNMKKPAYLFDGRNILDKNKLKSIGFNYVGLGR